MHSAKAESRFAEQILHIFEEDMAQRSGAIRISIISVERSQYGWY